MPSQSKFLVVEGCNGVGKSTVVEYLKGCTGASSFHYPPEFVSFRREVRLDETLLPIPRLTYYLAATLHLSDLVRRQLEKSHVICDRYLASPLSLVLAESAIDETMARNLVKPFESYFCKPDLTLLLTADHAEASTRINRRLLQTNQLTPVAKMTLESEELFRKREDASRRIALSLGPLMELDTTNLSPAEMCDVRLVVVSAQT